MTYHPCNYFFEMGLISNYSHDLLMAQVDAAHNLYWRDLPINIAPENGVARAIRICHYKHH